MQESLEKSITGSHNIVDIHVSSDKQEVNIDRHQQNCPNLIFPPGAGDLTGDPFGYVTGVLAVIIHASYLVLIQKTSLDSEYGPLTAQYAIAIMATPVRTDCWFLIIIKEFLVYISVLLFHRRINVSVSLKLPFCFLFLSLFYNHLLFLSASVFQPFILFPLPLFLYSSAKLFSFSLVFFMSFSDVSSFGFQLYFVFFTFPCFSFCLSPSCTFT